MNIEVPAKLANLCPAIRQVCEMTGYSHKMILDAVNAHLGKCKQNYDPNDNKRSDGKYNAKKDTFSFNVKLSVKVVDTASIQGLFVAWHDQIAKLVCPTEIVRLPEVFTDMEKGDGKGWLKFAHKSNQNEPAAK